MERALARNALPYQGHDYPATGHWFAESSSEAFDASAADLAAQRDLRFLGSNR